MVSRIYVEKKPGFDVEASQLLSELRTVIADGLPLTATLRIINVYDVEGISDELFEQCIPTVFSEPQVDRVSRELPVEGAVMGELGERPGHCILPPRTCSSLPSRPYLASLTSVPTPPPSAYSSFRRASARPFRAQSSMCSTAAFPMRRLPLSSAT